MDSNENSTPAAVRERPSRLAESADRLDEALDHTITLEQIARILSPTLGDACVVDALDDSGCVRQAAEAHADPAQEATLRAQRAVRVCALESDAPTARVLRTGASILIPTLADAEGDSSSFAPDARSVMIAALTVRGRRLGAIACLSMDAARVFGPDDLALLEQFARRAAIALDNARLFHAEQTARATAERRAARIARLQTVADRLAEALPADNVAALIVEQASDALSASAGTLLLIDDGGTHLEMVASRGPPDGTPFDTAALAAEVVRRGEAMFIASRAELSVLFPNGLSGEQDEGEAYACVPIRLQGRVAGALSLRFREARAFDDDDRSFVLTLARHYEHAVERAKLLAGEREARERAEASERRQRLLADAGAALASTLDHKLAMERMVRLVVPGFADGAVVSLLQSDGTLMPLALAGLDPEREALAWEYARHVSGRRDRRGPLRDAMRRGRAELVTDTRPETRAQWATDAPSRELLTKLAPQMCITAPLTLRGRVIGALGFYLTETERSWDRSDVALVEELARRASLAIECAELFRDAQLAREESDRSGQLKDQFLATLSHELRTPLNAVLGWVRMLRLGSIPPDRQPRVLETIERNAYAQAALIEELLDVSRIASGKLRLHVMPFEIDKEIESAIDAIRPAAAEKGVSLHFARPSPSHSIVGDPDRIQQVVWNLLSNSVKFTGRGGAIEVALGPTAAGVEITVSDTGEGIDAAFLPHVFDRFRQAESPSTHRNEGLGLGLSIVKQVVDMHGGSVFANSPGLGCGATFIVRLPRESAAS